MRHNDELKNMFRKRGIVIAQITWKRLMWAGHARKKEDSLIKAVFKENPTGKRPLGRPQLLWEDHI